jgi:KaiC/GvpD/RAD55 family RecA-like ATPase
MVGFAGLLSVGGLVYLPHTGWDFLSTESMQNEILCELSQHGMRLHVNWVNAKLIDYFLKSLEFEFRTQSFNDSALIQST